MKFKTVKEFLLFIVGKDWEFANGYRYICFKFDRFSCNIYIFKYKGEFDSDDIFDTIYGNFEDNYYLDLRSGNIWSIDFEITDEIIKKDMLYRIEIPTYKGEPENTPKFIDL